MEAEYLSTGEAARRLSIPRHRLLYAFESGRLREPPRVAGRRLIPADRLSEIAERLGLKAPAERTDD